MLINNWGEKKSCNKYIKNIPYLEKKSISLQSTFPFIVMMSVFVRFFSRLTKAPASMNAENPHSVKSSSLSTAGIYNACVFPCSKLQSNEISIFGQNKRLDNKLHWNTVFNTPF